MIDHVVVDVEIAHCIEETPGGWDATDKLGVAVACVWQYSDQRMRVYGLDDVDALRDRLLAADRISGYNILNFDYPVIWGVSKADWKDWKTAGDKPEIRDRVGGINLKATLAQKTDDMLRRIWIALGIDPDNYVGKTHGSCKLDDVAAATLGVRKIGCGGDAPKWFQAGMVQKVVNYCCDDTCLERDLCDFIEQYGYVLVGGKKIVIPPWNGGK